MFIYQTSADVCRLLPYNRFFNFFKKGKRKERPNVLHYENSKPPSYHNCGAANIEKEKKKKKQRDKRRKNKKFTTTFEPAKELTNFDAGEFRTRIYIPDYPKNRKLI